MSTHVVARNELGLKALLMGNEAIARGAIEGGVKVAASYPGTPASEIMETLSAVANELGIYAEWSVNEKVAFEVAAGAALSNVRAFCSMKNAGLNWCMDMLTTIVYGGVRGGMVIVVADDPVARTSSNEQDQRFAASWAEIPCLEPSDQQEAKNMVREAFEISEKIELPVIVRSVAHKPLFRRCSIRQDSRVTQQGCFRQALENAIPLECIRPSKHTQQTCLAAHANAHNQETNRGLTIQYSKPQEGC